MQLDVIRNVTSATIASPPATFYFRWNSMNFSGWAICCEGPITFLIQLIIQLKGSFRLSQETVECSDGSILEIRTEIAFYGIRTTQFTSIICDAIDKDF